MSISPQAGQPTVFIFEPNNHNAGQVPPPSGSFALISTVPYVKSNLFKEINLADV